MVKSTIICRRIARSYPKFPHSLGGYLFDNYTHGPVAQIVTSCRIDRSISCIRIGPGALRPEGQEASRRVRARSQGGEKTMFRSAAPEPDHPALGSRPFGGCLLAFVAINNAAAASIYVFRNISPLHVTGWSFAWPILPSQSAAARRRHQARGTRQGPDPRPDPDRVRPRGLPRPAQRGRGLEQGPQVQERLPAVL